MNKKLIALAVAAALAPAAALADSGNVTIYGQANASYDNISTDTDSQDTLSRISSNSSRLGFKGTEDLGNGLSAVWQMESSIMLDTGAGNLGGRNSFVGLSSKTMGTAILGRHDTPYKLGTGSLDVFADTMGDYNSIIGSLNGTIAFDSRLGNVAAYISPTWSGFHFALATVAANETGNLGVANGKAYSATGVYANGPLFASLSWEKAKDTAGADATATGVAAVGTGNSASSVKLGLGYTIDALKLGFVYENSNTDGTLVGNGMDRTAYLLNAAYKMGNNTLKAAFAKASDGDSTADTSAKQITLGVEHAMSKRTAVYALYTKMDNADGATYNIGGNGAGGAYTPAAGKDPRAISLGMKHSF
jgi:predicted porin